MKAEGKKRMNILFCNGTIFGHPEAEALLVKEGRIAALGSIKELTALCGGKRPEVQDLAGNTLLPAFIDSHSHLAAYADSLRFAQLGETGSLDEVVELLQRHARAKGLPKGEWLCGVGYHPEKLGGQPDKRVLDRVGEWPVLITAASGHMGCMNSLGLQKAGIGQETADPAGGRFGRSSGGELNGYLEENAFFRMAGILPQPDEKEQLAALEQAQQVYASYGIATAQEGLLHPQEMELLKKADRQGRLLIEVIGYADYRERERFPRQQERLDLTEIGNFRIGGYKLILDGSPQGRTAWLTKPYRTDEAHPKEERGYPVYEDEQVRQVIHQTQREGRQLLTHCNGDAAIDQLLRAYEGPVTTRDVIIHAQTIRKDQLLRVKELGLMPSYFAAHVHRYGDVHLRQLGRERAEQISPLRTTVEMNIPFTLHQDTPVMPPDMLHTLYCACCRLTEEGVLLGGEERISLPQALEGVTANAAYQYFEERRKGKLLPGMDGDLTVVEGDLNGMPPKELLGQRVIATWRKGKEIYRR